MDVIFKDGLKVENVHHIQVHTPQHDMKLATLAFDGNISGHPESKHFVRYIKDIVCISEEEGVCMH